VCETKYIRQLEERKYEEAKEGYKLVQNRVLIVCDSCETLKEKARLKGNKDTMLE
jgi:hypothetical protein